ncbi:MAG: hypothetical protein HYY06_14855 [Deltaproteobacteria bacterium]|nr:hypothetical protein [Deltaproteobacteria bacterium]
MRRIVLACWLLLVPAAASAQQDGIPPSDEIVVEGGDPVPVPLDAVANRIGAELPGTEVVVSPTVPPRAASVTLGVSPEGRILVVYRDGEGRETTRIVADSHDPRSMTAAIAMIVANLHRSQLDPTLAAMAPLPPPPPGPAETSPRPVGPPRSAGRARLQATAIARPAPAPALGWVLELGGLYAVVAASAQVGVGYGLGDHLRLSAMGQMAYVFEGGGGAYTLGLALSRIGSGSKARFDWGAHTALLVVEDGEGWIVGPHVGWSWDLWGALTVGARLAVDLAVVEGSPTVWPSATLAVELPLS